MNYKQEVKKLLVPYFDSALVDRVVSELDTMGFFEQSCSTKFHGSYRGGLVEHSIEVAKNLIIATKVWGYKWSRPASPIIVGLFHDLCKFDAYIEYQGKFVWNNAQLANGKHAVKSLALLDREPFKSLALTMEEQVAILWHMGGFSKELKDKTFDFNGDVSQYPLALEVMNADMTSTYRGRMFVGNDALMRIIDTPTKDYPFTGEFLFG